jgi:hypothetical protein
VASVFGMQSVAEKWNISLDYATSGSSLVQFQNVLLITVNILSLINLFAYQTNDIL